MLPNKYGEYTLNNLKWRILTRPTKSYGDFVIAEDTSIKSGRQQENLVMW